MPFITTCAVPMAKPGLKPIEATKLAELAKGQGAKAVARRLRALAAVHRGLQEAAVVLVAFALLAGVKLNPAQSSKLGLSCTAYIAEIAQTLALEQYLQWLETDT